MSLRPHIKLLPSTLEAHHGKLYICQLPFGHNLHYTWGCGTSFRSAYNNWLDQVRLFI